MSGRRVAVAGVICVGVLAAGILVIRPEGKASAAPTPTANASSNQVASMAAAVHTSTPTSILLTPESATPKSTRSSSATATEPTDDDAPVVVGDGFSDVSPHQVVRTSDDILYVIVPDCDAYPDCPESRLHAYRANTPGTGASFREQDPDHAPAGGVGTSAVAIDGNDLIHVAWVDRSGAAVYARFDTANNRWSVPTVLADTGWTTFGQGDQGAALALDAAGNPHAFWNGVGDDGSLHIWYAHARAGNWTDPVQVDDAELAHDHKAWHPTIAFTSDGRLLLAWLDGTFNYTPDGVIRVREREADGTWSPSVAIDDVAMTAIDNGPSLLVTPDGTQHITFLNAENEIRYWYDTGAGWRGDHQPPTQQTHNPSLGPDGAGGVFLYGHGTPHGVLDGHGDNLYRFHLPEGGGWSDWTLYATGAFDSSVSTRWSQFFHTSPETLDILFWADPYPNILYLGTETVTGE